MSKRVHRLDTNVLVEESRWLLLPGSALVATGLRDLAKQELSRAAMAVLLAKSRLIDCGFLHLARAAELVDPEQKLYDSLSDEFGDSAHAYFNSLRQELVSFANAMDHLIYRLKHPTP